VRCLLVADLHYDLRKFDWVLAAAPHMDVVVLAGDHLDAAGTVARSTQAIVAQQYFRRIRERTTLLVCSGNHDLDHRDGRGLMSTKWITRARHFDIVTDGDSRVIGDTLFTSCPWSDSKLLQRQVADQLDRAAAARPSRWIWLHHAPPNQSPVSWDGRRFYGDDGLGPLILRHQPDLVLAGHVHQAPFTRAGSWADRIGDTWVFNAGHQIGPLPSHVVVDTARRTAFWNSLAGAEVAALEAPLARPFPPVADPPPWLLAIARPAAPPPG
jgi:Icc-related predicted phosphoesterase